MVTIKDHQRLLQDLLLFFHHVENCKGEEHDSCGLDLGKPMKKKLELLKKRMRELGTTSTSN